ncbi:MAG: alpha/beta hydrolase-fold protein [Ferruginibacter sp.]|nr:alpha/beta hydrolase-fold protein [Ferruginibacter sp.]
MSINQGASVVIENHVIQSVHLKILVKVDCYLPPVLAVVELILLLINDGQDLVTMQFDQILNELQDDISPLFCVGLHCSADRKMEYGTAAASDYKGRGAKAGLYTKFVMEELLPYLRKTYQVMSFKEKSFAGFSLGGLSAMDIVWSNPKEFINAGIFSGSFWWRDKDQAAADFDEDIDRIMHRLVRSGEYYPWLKFFFEVGTLDETADRNNNGIIDAIDDTLGLIAELEKKGYANGAIQYLELEDGRHDVPTWARAFPTYLKWAWGRVAH